MSARGVDNSRVTTHLLDVLSIVPHQSKEAEQEDEDNDKYEHRVEQKVQ